MESKGVQDSRDNIPGQPVTPVALYQGGPSIFNRSGASSSPSVAVDVDGGDWGSTQRLRTSLDSGAYESDPNVRSNTPTSQVQQRRTQSNSIPNLSTVRSVELETLSDEERKELEHRVLAGPQNGSVVKWMKRLVFIPAAAASISEALFSSSFVARIWDSLWSKIPTGAVSFVSNASIRSIALTKTIDQVSSDLSVVECSCRPGHRERAQPYGHLVNTAVLDHSEYYEDDAARKRSEFAFSSIMETLKLGAISAAGAAPDFALAKYSLYKPGALDWMPKGLQITIIAIVLPNRVITSLALGFRGVAGSRIYTYKLFSDKHIRKKAIDVRKIVIDYYSKKLAEDAGWVPMGNDREYLSQGFTTRPSIIIEVVSAVAVVTYSIVSYKSAMKAWSCDGLSYYPQAFCELGLGLGAICGFTRKYLLLLGANRGGWNRVFASRVNIFPEVELTNKERYKKWAWNGGGCILGLWTTTSPAEMILHYVFDGVDTPGTKAGSMALAGIAVFWINGFDFVILATEDIPRMIRRAKEARNAQDLDQLFANYQTNPVQVVKAFVMMRDRPLYELWMNNQDVFRKMQLSAKDNRIAGENRFKDINTREQHGDDIEMALVERAPIGRAALRANIGTMGRRTRGGSSGTSYTELDDDSALSFPQRRRSGYTELSGVPLVRPDSPILSPRNRVSPQQGDAAKTDLAREGSVPPSRGQASSAVVDFF